MHKTIRVDNLDSSVDARMLGRMFIPYGIVYGAKVSTDHDTGQSTGVGFVEMDAGADGESAVAALDGNVHFNHILAVRWDIPVADPNTTTDQMFGPMNMPDTTIPSDEMLEKRAVPPEEA